MGMIVLAVWLILAGLVAVPAQAETVTVRWLLAPTCHVFTLSVDIGESQVHAAGVEALRRLSIKGVDDQCIWFGDWPVWGDGQLTPDGGATLRLQRALFFGPPSPEIHFMIQPTGEGAWCTTVGVCGWIEWR